MNIDQDTCQWLGCPTPLEMYKHQCALLEDELIQTQAMLSKARANIAGLVQMNDQLATSKANADEAVRAAVLELEELKSACSEPGILSMKLVAEQRDFLLRENQRLLMEMKAQQLPAAPIAQS